MCDSCAALSPVTTGAFVGLSPHTKLQDPPNWNMKHYTSVEFLPIFRMSSPPVQTQSSPQNRKTRLLKTFWRRFWQRSSNQTVKTGRRDLSSIVQSMENHEKGSKDNYGHLIDFQAIKTVPFQLSWVSWLYCDSLVSHSFAACWRFTSFPFVLQHSCSLLKVFNLATASSSLNSLRWCCDKDTQVCPWGIFICPVPIP